MRYLFEEYAFDTDRRELHRGADVVSVAPQVFDLIDDLIRNRQRVVSKDDLIKAIWNGRSVSDAALTTRLNAARTAIGDSGAGYGHYTTPNGRSGTFYSPTAAVMAQNNAAVQNEAMFAATVETGQRNMAMLEQSVIKDNTLMPGEWYGGQLHLAPPTDQAGGQKTYTIIITVGNDRHVVEVAQGAAGT